MGRHSKMCIIIIYFHKSADGFNSPIKKGVIFSFAFLSNNKMLLDFLMGIYQNLLK